MRRIPALLVLLALTLMTAGCGSDTGESNSPSKRGRSDERAGAPASAVPKLRLVEVGRFNQPVHALPVPGTDHVAIVEKGGRVLVVSDLTCVDEGRCPRVPATDGKVVVDLRGSVSTGNEQGLLGMAFHPEWPDDARVFLNYTDEAGDTRIEAWKLAAPTARAVRERELLRVEQPYANHNGGHLAFGPDGLLYVGMGDGGDAGDPQDRAQQPDELLGKLLRLDVDAGGERGYGIPEGNLSDGAREAWGVGLRNPWRFSFDSETGDLWIGDVGQNAWEELNALPAARLGSGGTPNFGWRRYEGYEEFEGGGTTGPGTLVEPVLAYGRDDGCSITGGVVYRGALAPDLVGWYLFADFCADDLRMLRADGIPGSTRQAGELSWERADGAAQVASFAQVQGGELLLVSLSGTIHQVLPA